LLITLIVLENCLGASSLNRCFYFWYKDQSAYYLGTLKKFDETTHKFEVEFADRSEPNEYHLMRLEDETKDSRNDDRFFSADGFKCSVCYESKPNVVFRSDCGHEICQSCLSNYLAHFYKDAGAPSPNATCFQVGCKEELSYSFVVSTPLLGNAISLCSFVSFL
jgi:hypothetical protein